MGGYVKRRLDQRSAHLDRQAQKLGNQLARIAGNDKGKRITKSVA